MPLSRLRYALALGAGLLLAAAFPNLGVAGFAWIAPGLMLAAALGGTGKQSFRLGYATGFAFWLASLYWLLLIPVAWFPILGWLALAAYNALFQATWVWLCWKCFPNGVPASALRTFQSSSRLDRFRWSLLCAALWVALEMIRCRFLSGFPWSLLGNSQFQMTPLLQISSVTGVYGVSFLIVWTSVSLLCAGLMILRPKTSRTTLAAEVFVPLLTVAVVFATGYWHILRAPSAPRTVRLTTIQPSIPQTMIWDPKSNDRRFADLLALSERALSNRTDALLWPEAAMPELNEASYTAITNLVIQHQVWFIFGADDVQLRPGATNDHDVEFFNAAWLLSPRGLIADTYHKRRLVIFGEYIPLVDWLPFIKWFTPITGSYSSGKAPTQFPLRDAGVTAAPLICFEDCFPQVHDHVTADTDLLINLTNDGWFGQSAEQWQHAANAVFRAIENGVPLVRSCNNGLTCWVDEFGQIHDAFRDEAGTIYGTGFTTFTVPLHAKPHPRTFYNRHGDVFGWACVALAGLAVASRAIRRKG
jgi:apolipoprotein N-acyltransferase